MPIQRPFRKPAMPTPPPKPKPLPPGTVKLRKGNREARYRVERNQAREALAEAQARIETYQRREVERLAADLAQPEDIFELGGASLADLLGEDGEVNADAVSEAVNALIETRPGLAKNPRVLATDTTQGLGGNPGKPKAGWEALFDH
jgi:hypothetical protein